MRISVFGSGYVGLVAAACFADVGNDVISVDIDEKKIQFLKKGIIPIYEPGLEEYIKRNVKEERLEFTTDMKYAVEKSQVILISVGTPADEDGSADLSHVLAVAKTVGEYMNGFKIVVDKSTVPVGTTEKVTNEIKKYTKHDVAVVSNPEFLKEGAAINDFMKPDRVILGTSNEEAAEIMRNLYLPFVRTGKPIILMDERSAELTKYAANSLLATKISFMNEMANLCDEVGADVEMVRRGIGSDSRIGPYFIFPGTGYGGSCFPKDVKAIIKTADEYSCNLSILKSVEAANNKQKTILIDKILNYFNGQVKNKTFAMWGLAFKPRTNDMREAPSIEMINALIKHGAKIHAHDPAALDETKIIYGEKIGKEIILFEKRYDSLENTDGLIVMTEWNQFREPDFYLIKETLKNAVIFDGRNLYQPARLRKLGIDYFCIGRPHN
jgi:UDPglucose 6-dehydrogenase